MAEARLPVNMNSRVVGAAMTQGVDHLVKQMGIHGCIVEVADSSNPTHKRTGSRSSGPFSRQRPNSPRELFVGVLGGQRNRGHAQRLSRR